MTEVPAPAQTQSPDAAPVESAEVQTANTTPEVPKETAPKQQDKLGAAYAKLAREQRNAREAAEKLKAERLAFDKERSEYQAYAEAKQNAKRFPLKFLESMGLTYQDLVEAQLNEGQPTPSLEAKAVRDELDQFKRQVQEREDRAAQESQAALKAQQAQLVEEFRQQVHAHVKTNAEKYELVNLCGAADTVFKVIDQYAAEQVANGTPANEIKLLSFDEAADLVEQDLEAQAEKLRSTKKFSAKEAAQPAPTSPLPKKQPEQQTRSITNQLSSSTQAAQSKKSGLSRAEREQRAMALLNSSKA